MNCLTRFDFKLIDRDDHVNSSFIKHRNSCHQAARVIAMLKKYIESKMKMNKIIPPSSQVINPTLNFRKELLLNK